VLLLGQAQLLLLLLLLLLQQVLLCSMGPRARYLLAH
jgi:hypothetical protein